jgi:hypothetical protein
MEPRPGLPPMSTTSLPPGGEPVASSAPVIRAPILASDILREEIAPLAPARGALRGVLLPLSAGFALWGVASLAGFTVPAPFEASAAFVTAGAAGLAAALPGPYGARALLATLAGLLPLVLGALWQGPLAELGMEGPTQAGAALVVATLVPAALFFRAQYRAFGVARGMLVLALALSGPAVFFFAGAALSNGAPLLLRGASGLALFAVSTSLAGFLGAETTGGCNAWAILILGASAARVFVVSWLGASAGHDALSLTAEATCVATGLGALAASGVASVGLYQLLAALFARRARLADVHQIVGPSAEEEA